VGQFPSRAFDGHGALPPEPSMIPKNVLPLKMEMRREQAGALFAGAFRLPAGRPLIAAAEPSPDVNNERNCSQYEHEMYERHYRYFGRMVLYPFPPSQPSRSRNSDQEFPCRPQPSPETFTCPTSGVPNEMVDNPARDFPMNRSGHPASVSLPFCGIDFYGIDLSRIDKIAPRGRQSATRKLTHYESSESMPVAVSFARPRV